MNQVGTVIEVMKNKRAKILMKKHSACGDCGACQHGKENMSVNIVAYNGLGAQSGDLVEVDMETQNVLGAAFIVYVIPLLMIILGIGVGNYVLQQIRFQGNIEVYSALIGLALMGISFGIIRLFEKRFNKDKKYVPTISKILTR